MVTTILIVEDDVELRASLRKVLSGAGYRILEAGDGVAGVQVALRERPDLILMDLSMPIMDGWQAATLLRKQEDLCPPIVSLSSWHDHPPAETNPKQIFDGNLPKPFRLCALLAEVENYLNEPKGDQT